MNQIDHVVDVSELDFETEVVERSRQVPVVVDFWAPWCGPCRMLSPLLERLTKEAGGSFVLAKINVDENPSLSMRYGIQGIPAVKGFRGGKVVAEFVGAQPEPMVRQFLKQLAPSEADRAQEEGAALLADYRWSEAEALFRRALAANPDQPAVALGLVKALLGQGKGAEALAEFDTFGSSLELAAAENLRLMARVLAEPLPAGAVNGSGPDADYGRARELMQAGKHSEAMDAILQVLRRDKRYRQGEAHKVMLALLELLGETDLTRQYRSKLASVLF